MIASSFPQTLGAVPLELGTGEPAACQLSSGLPKCTLISVVTQASLVSHIMCQ